MKLSSLKKFTQNEFPIQEFISELSDELSEYKKRIGKTGTSIPIYVTEDIDFEIGFSELRTLCQYFIDEKLDTEALAYLADAIELSSKVYVPEDKIKAYIFEMTDPEINGIFTKARAIQILDEIKTQSVGELERV